MDILSEVKISPPAAKPNLGFLGVGWIGKNRMEAIRKENILNCRYILDPDANCAEEALKCVPEAKSVESFDSLLQEQPQGIVIATPSAMHAEQSIQALSKGIAVFCQKPLGRNAAECKMVVDMARNQNCLLGLDLSYRFTKAAQAIKALITEGSLGEIFAVDLTFHNAYGPDKPWFYDPALSGGGCVIDLGVHLVDMAMWMLDFQPVTSVHSTLLSKGKILKDPEEEVEDFATALLQTSAGTAIQLTCSWNLHAGKDAEISASFYGTNGGASFNNVNGSFYDFEAHHFQGTSQKILFSGEDNWGGKAAVTWAKELAGGNKFNAVANEYLFVADVIDRIYGRV